MKSDERENIAAAVGAHAELGPRYDEAVAESLVERIGDEIDKRVDARLAGRPAAAAPPAPAPSVPQRNGVVTVFLGLGSMGLGVGVTAAVVHSATGSFAKVVIAALIWFAIIAINAIASGPRR